MKKIKKLLFVGMFPILALTMGSCTDYQDEVDALDRRVTTLEELVSRTNKSIEGISTLLGAAENGWLITGMVDVPAKDDPAGLGYYTITLGKIDPATGKLSEKPEDKKTLTIYNGKDAEVPNIEIRKGEDGNYYWYIDGNPVLDPTTGQPVQANGKDGKDGKDGVSTAPMLKIEDGYWMISYDGGATYTPMLDSKGNPISCTGKDGKDAEPIIKGVTIKIDVYGNRYAEFDLGNGQIVLVPLID
jgi:hypothetical protein